MFLPRIVVTGASGFVGRHLLEKIKESYTIVGIGRRSQRRCDAPVHPNITWAQIDIGDREPLARLFEGVAQSGGADVLLHLAAHYDFTGDEHAEYWRTNVEGLRNVLEFAKGLKLRRFIFASSVAASRFPPPGHALDETSVPDGDHIYARTKRIGEEMVREYSAFFPTCTVRFAALFSDWCEYAPLYVFLETWLSKRWNARVLGGRGASAIPYLHVRDAVRALRILLAQPELPHPHEVFVISPDRAVSHRELFTLTRMAGFGRASRPICMPRPLCGVGMLARHLFGRALGEQPFERPWMARYVDLKMTVDASHTRGRLGWAPRPRLEILRRLPFLFENRKTHPIDWNSLNLAAMKGVRTHTNLRVHQLLETNKAEIRGALTDRLLDPGSLTRFSRLGQISRKEHDWSNRLLLDSLMASICTREKALFRSHCRDLAERRRTQGFTADEVCFALRLFNETCIKTCIKTLSMGPASLSLAELNDCITATVEFGIDEVEDVFDQDDGGR